jgi:hypothetical protein
VVIENIEIFECNANVKIGFLNNKNINNNNSISNSISSIFNENSLMIDDYNTDNYCNNYIINNNNNNNTLDHTITKKNKLILSIKNNIINQNNNISTVDASINKINKNLNSKDFKNTNNNIANKNVVVFKKNENNNTVINSPSSLFLIEKDKVFCFFL